MKVKLLNSVENTVANGEFAQYNHAISPFASVFKRRMLQLSENVSSSGKQLINIIHYRYLIFLQCR